MLNNKSLNLIVETNNYDSKDYQFLWEEANMGKEKTLYIKGPYTQGDVRNRNERIYPLHELSSQINEFNTNYVLKSRATGELEHPEYPSMNASQACHMIVEMSQDGNTFIGKSKVLSSPKGKILECLIKDGLNLGISSRSLGTVDDEGFVSNLKLSTFDVVSDPSCQAAYVNGILEAKQFICNQDNKFEESYNSFEKKINDLPVGDVDLYLKEQINAFIMRLSIK